MQHAPYVALTCTEETALSDSLQLIPIGRFPRYKYRYRATMCTVQTLDNRSITRNKIRDKQLLHITGKMYEE